MPNFDQSSNLTGSALATMASNSVRKLWHQGFLMAEQSTDFLQKLEGTGTNAPIQVKTDLGKGKGQKITFSVLSGFYREPHIGDELFNGPDDFEDILMSDFELLVDWARHGVRNLERTEEIMGMRGEIASRFNVEQGKWLGRLKTEQAFMLMVRLLNSENIFYAGGKTLNTLKSADVLAWDEVTTLGQVMKPLGGLPADIRKPGSPYPIWSNIVIPTEAAMNSLKLDPDYKTVNSNADVRGPANTLFSGTVRDIDGHVLHVYNPIDHDGKGAIGSPLNPKAVLGEAISPGNTALTIKGGGTMTNTTTLWFKYFRGYRYKFLGNTSASSANAYTEAPADATEEKYLLIINPKNATTDPGKIGMYAYTAGQNGNTIVLTKRLGATAGGSSGPWLGRVSTLGNVTWDTGVWNGKHTDDHPVGATIIPCNSYGVPIGHTPMLMRSGIMRGYGKYRGHRSQQDHEGGFIMDRFITSVFGQCLREDRLGRHVGVGLLTHALNYPELGLPTVS
jgi:hypothetical protein